MVHKVQVQVTMVVQVVVAELMELHRLLLEVQEILLQLVLHREILVDQMEVFL